MNVTQLRKLKLVDLVERANQLGITFEKKNPLKQTVIEKILEAQKIVPQTVKPEEEVVTFPVEIWELICSRLGPEELLRIVRTNKVMKKICEPYLQRKKVEAIGKNEYILVHYKNGKYRYYENKKEYKEKFTPNNPKYFFNTDNIDYTVKISTFENLPAGYYLYFIVDKATNKSITPYFTGVEKFTKYKQENIGRMKKNMEKAKAKFLFPYSFK